MALNYLARVVSPRLVELRTVRLGMLTASICVVPELSSRWWVSLHQPSRFGSARRPDSETYPSWAEACEAVAGWSGDSYELERFGNAAPHH